MPDLQWVPFSFFVYSQLLLEGYLESLKSLAPPQRDRDLEHPGVVFFLLLDRSRYTHFLQPQLIARAASRDGFVLALGKRSLCLEMCNQDRVLEFLISYLTTKWPPLVL